MSEEILKYRVEIDQSDLASQLSGIKNQIDTAIGSMAFNNAGGGGGSSFGNSVVSSVANFSGDLSNGIESARDSFGRVGRALEGGMSSGRLGYQKFAGDLERTGLVTPPEYARQLQFSDMASRTYSSESRGLIGSTLGGALGAGYDWNMPITREEYKSQQSENAGSQLVDKASTAIGLGGALVGFTAGAGSLAASIATPVGWAATAAWGVNALANVANYEGEAVDNLSNLIEQTSVRNVGRIEGADATGAAKYVRGLSEDVNTRAKIGDATDVENLVTEGIASGAFIDTGNVQEFKKRAKDLVENFREIQHTMKVSGEEAMEMIGGMTQGGMANNIKDVKSLVSLASAIGEDTGFTTKDMLGFAQQGAEMVRGTGLDMGKAGKEAMGLIQEIRGGYGTVYDRAALDHVGGTQQASQALQQMSLNYGNSMSGRVMSAAIMNGYDITSGGTIGEIAMKAGENLPMTAGGVLDWQTQQREFRDDMSYWERSNVELAQIATQFKAVGMDTFSKSQLTQKFINDGLTAPMAEIKASNMLSDPMERFQKELDNLGSMSNTGKDRIGKIESVSAQASIAVREWWKYGIGAEAEDIVDEVKGVGNFFSNLLSGDSLAGEDRAYYNRVQNADTLDAHLTSAKRYEEASPDQKRLMDEVESDRLKVQGTKKGGEQRAKTTIEMLDEIGANNKISSRGKDMKQARDALIDAGIDKDVAATVSYADINNIVKKGEFRGEALDKVQLNNIIIPALDQNLIEMSENSRADSELRVETTAELQTEYRKDIDNKLDGTFDDKFKVDGFFKGLLFGKNSKDVKREKNVKQFAKDYADSEDTGDQFASNFLELLAKGETDSITDLLLEDPTVAREKVTEEMEKAAGFREKAKNADTKKLKDEYNKKAENIEGTFGKLAEIVGTDEFKKAEINFDKDKAAKGKEDLEAGMERYEDDKKAFDAAGIDPNSREGKLILSKIGSVTDGSWAEKKKEILKKGGSALQNKKLLDMYLSEPTEKEIEAKKELDDQYKDENIRNKKEIAILDEEKTGGWFGGADSEEEFGNRILKKIYDEMITMNSQGRDRGHVKDSEKLENKKNSPKMITRTN